MSRPFRPADGKTVTVSASTTSADEAFVAGSHAIRVLNTTNRTAHVKTARGSALTATVADFPVAAGGEAIIGIPSDHNIVAVILASGATSGSVYVTPGTGGHLS